jgi:hypothetical protein
VQERWPRLRIAHLDMNGADDVLKYRKWEWASPTERMITMLRPGASAPLSAALTEAGIPTAGTANFVLGPEMPECSSTQARKAAVDGDNATLQRLLHPRVAERVLALWHCCDRRKRHTDASADADETAPSKRSRTATVVAAPPSQSAMHGAERSAHTAATARPATVAAVAATAQAASKIATKLAEACPTSIKNAAARLQWALELEQAVKQRHTNARDMKTRVRDLLANLRSNGETLIRYPTEQLATMPSSQLAEGSTQHSMLVSAERGAHFTDYDK